jgi:hypothetical protein
VLPLLIIIFVCRFSSTGADRRWVCCGRGCRTGLPVPPPECHRQLRLGQEAGAGRAPARATREAPPVLLGIEESMARKPLLLHHPWLPRRGRPGAAQVDQR